MGVSLQIFRAIAGAIVILSAVFSKYVQSDTEEAFIKKLFTAEVHIGWGAPLAPRNPLVGWLPEHLTSLLGVGSVIKVNLYSTGDFS